MKFDWYQASIPEVNPGLIMDALAKDDYYGQWVEVRPLKGYDIGAQFVLGTEVKYRINHGGQNAEYGANVLGSGGFAQDLANVIKLKFPVHRISRVDVCEDYHHKDVYKYLRRKSLSIAKEHKVQVREIVKPLPESDDGRTLYLGSQKSSISFRLYEKGKQLGCGTEWVRAELQARPQKKMKEILSRLSAEEIWGVSKWSHALASSMGNKNAVRIKPVIFQPSDRERAYRWFLKQYGPLLIEMKDDHGSWEALGGQIGYDLEHPDEERTKIELGSF